MERIRWGVLSTANIGVAKVIPAMQAGELCEVTAIASRSADRAQATAKQLGIPKAYGSYEELLADPDVDAVYNPMPNHLHVPWSIKALQAGKHMLCEKPIGLTSAEAQELIEAARAHPHLYIMEAFMYRHHPQWQLASKLVDDGEIGELKTVHTAFAYYNVDPENVRNMADIGGGGLMDIGCYCISVPRFLFAAEPLGVTGMVEFDPRFRTDRLASGMLEFANGTATFTCSTQLAPYQRVNIFGTEGRVEIDIPFNPPPDRPCKVTHEKGADSREIMLEVCDQYTLQGDVFARSILDKTPVPTPLEDALANMQVIEAVLRSAEQGGRVTPGG
ncbi:MAG: Gfo/Idh/MocA family oxidoreductase [Gammaproteobacteria bacterium]|nr:Gfo/Idh/MocA family oxidoreductase [Gammaproteobacteria bacterium]